MQLPSLGYLFGRVISTTARWSITPDGGTTNLVYVFKHQSPSKTMPDRSHLHSDQLLIPPQLINRLGWSRGYFETLGNLPFGPGEVLPVHCFERRGYRAGPSRWFNERAEGLPAPIPPVGISWYGVRLPPTRDCPAQRANHQRRHAGLAGEVCGKSAEDRGPILAYAVFLDRLRRVCMIDPDDLEAAGE